MLTGRYLEDIPADSRAAKPHGFLGAEAVEDHRETVRALDSIARQRGQSLAQMALAWVLRQGVVASALIGASRVAQIDENLDALKAPGFTDEELAAIDRACGL
jgi:L-glyceraldehyde 3-phosphate reductase